MTEQENVTF